MFNYMLKNLKTYKVFFLFVIVFISQLQLEAQEVNIVPSLKKIENGEKEEAKKDLKTLKENFQNDPSVLFLEAVLTENAQDAISIYSGILKNHPKSKYADAAVYRIYSYYYSLGLYKTADTYLNKLKTDYPNSPYNKIVQKDLGTLQDDEAVFLNDEPTKPDVNKENLQVKKDYKFTIQAGAFTNAENASSLKLSFNKSGFPSEVVKKNVAGTTFHVVLVGKFVNKEEALNFLQVINSEFKLDGRVIPIN